MVVLAIEWRTRRISPRWLLWPRKCRISKWSLARTVVREGGVGRGADCGATLRGEDGAKVESDEGGMGGEAGTGVDSGEGGEGGEDGAGLESGEDQEGGEDGAGLMGGGTGDTGAGEWGPTAGAVEKKRRYAKAVKSLRFNDNRSGVNQIIIGEKTTKGSFV